MPTSPDFLNLTDEQREFMWDSYLLDNPELDRKLRETTISEDREAFENEWNSLDEIDTKGESEFNEEEATNVISELHSEFENDPDLPTIEERLRKRGINYSGLENNQDNLGTPDPEDWEEEVDD